MKLRAQDIYEGAGSGAIIIGDAFGPRLLYVGSDVGDAFDEWDERDSARHVDPSDSALEDYEVDPRQLADAKGDQARARLFAAMDCGDVRVNGGGTFAWADPYEWCRSFRTVREAGLFWREQP